MEKGYLKVGDLAKRCGKTVRTIHYYEELGVLEPCQRTDGGFRLFTEDDIKRIETIGKVKRLAFPQVILSVPRSTVAIAAAELLQNFPIEDLTIEEPPIEEIIRKVFKGETRPKNVSK